MTLAQNAQVRDALDNLAADHESLRREEYDTGYPGHTRLVEQCKAEVEKSESALIDAIKSALLAEWSAGEGLNFEAATREATVPEAVTNPQHLGRTIIDPRLRDKVLDRQHRARLAAEREKWEAEVETLRGERDAAYAMLDGERYRHAVLRGKVKAYLDATEAFRVAETYENIVARREAFAALLTGGNAE